MDDGLAVGNQGFFDERALEEGDAQLDFCRFPSDPSPYPEEEDASCAGECFACTYGPKMTAATSSSSNSKVIYNDMINIISTMYGKTSNDTLVNMVHAFYTTEIEQHFNYGPWTKRSIWEHICYHMQDEHIQTSESIQTLTAAIELMRAQNLCQKSAGSDKFTIDHKNARLYMDMVKTRDALISNKLKRKTV
jgi:hypothetical protein